MPSPSRKPVRLAIIGTGNMAKAHALLYKKIKGCTLQAAVDIDKARATRFAKQHGIPQVYSSTEELLNADGADAVSIVTPDAHHLETALLCLKARKHVLCEKPLALNHADAKRMTMAAKRAGVVNMVNFSYRNWPCIQAVTTLVQSGKIGELRHVEASYHQSWLVSKEWGDWKTSKNWLWRLSTAHGSKGVLGDVGVHILDFATFPAGPIKNLFCSLKTFPKAPGNRIGEYILDANDTATMNVEFANGAVGSIQTTRWMGGHLNRLFLKISGTKGSVAIDSDLATDGYRICTGRNLDTNTWKEVTAKSVPNIHERFIKSIRNGTQDQPDFARGAEVQKLLDTCFTSNAQSRPVTLRNRK
jgi:predicted dehydrogenase